MKSQDDKIINYRGEKHRFNIVSFVFLLILIYLAVQLFFMFTKKAISIYEVQDAAQYSSDPSHTGIITRDESVVTLPESSYVNYCVSEGHKVSVGTTIYTTEDAGYFTDALVSQYSDAQILDESSIVALKNKLVKAAQKDIAFDFSEAYADKSDINITVFDTFLLYATENLGGLISDDEHCIKTSDSGYIIFRSDSYDTLDAADVTVDMLDKKSCTSTIYSTGEDRKGGDFAYKLVKDDSFEITFEISDYDAVRLSSKSSLKIELSQIGSEVSGALTIRTDEDGKKLATVAVSKYGSAYLTDRYIDFKIVDDNVYGYKIPKSAVLTKDYLVVPAAYVCKNGSSVGVYKEIAGSGSDSTDRNSFISVSVYAKVGNNYYISSSDLNEGDYILYAAENEQTGEYEAVASKRYLLSVKAPLTGVYNVNRGFTVFRQIDIIDESDDSSYYIVASDTSYGVSAHDRIILNAELVTESQILY